MCGVWEREVAGVRGVLPSDDLVCLRSCVSLVSFVACCQPRSTDMIKQHNQIRFLHRLILVPSLADIMDGLNYTLATDSDKSGQD